MKTTGAFLSTLCLAATLLSGSAAAQTDAGINFFAEPAPTSSSALGYFVIDAEPGESITQSIALRNDSKERMTLRLYPADATTSTYGGADYTPVDTETSGVGSWIFLQDDEVTLQPKKGTLVRFRVRVPDNAPTGENLGGIAIYPVVEASKAEKAKTAGNQASAQVVVEYRRVLAVQVNTPGKTEPDLVISGIRPTARPDGAYLDMHIANEGTALTKGKGVIRVPEFGYERKFDLDTFVPNSQIFYPLRFDDSIPSGEHEATIRIEYDEGEKVVEWASTFAVGEELQADLAERGAPGAARTTTRGNLVPVALALALGIVVFTFYRRRRRTEEPVGDASAPLIVPVVAFQPVDKDQIHVAPARVEKRKATVKKATVKKTTAKKPAATVRKAPVKKPVAKKTTARKKTTVRKTTASKTVAKKSAARKVTATKTAVKKSTARKTSTKNPAAKKTPAKKASARKSTKKCD